MGREESRREARKGKGRRQRQSPSSNQIADFGGCVRRRDARGHGRRQGEEEGPLSFSRTRLFACRHRCVCVLFRGPGEREQREREGRRRDRQRAGRRGERRAARASSRSFHGNFYQIFTIIPSGLDSAVRRHGEKERKRARDRAELYDGRAVNCLAPSVPPCRSVRHCLPSLSWRKGSEEGTKNLPDSFSSLRPSPLSLSLHACNTVCAVTSPYLPSSKHTHT